MSHRMDLGTGNTSQGQIYGLTFTFNNSKFCSYSKQTRFVRFKLTGFCAFKKSCVELFQAKMGIQSKAPWLP